MFQKYKSDLLFWAFIALLVIATFYLQEVLLPFFIGLLLALSSASIIKRMEKRLKKRAAAILVFLVSILLIVSAVLILFTGYINHDFQRLQGALKTFAYEHQDEINEGSNKVKDFISQYYNPEELRSFLEQKKDSISQVIENDELDFSQIDWTTIKESAEGVLSFFGSSEESVEEKSSGTEASFLVIFFSSILYFVYILFYLDYFETQWKKYILNKSSGVFQLIAQDFNRSFTHYFKLRSRIVFILTLFYLIGFSILGVPGALLLALIAGLLSFIPYLQYLTLIPLSLSCLILSMESGHPFYVYFGIVVGIFVLASILEETLLIPKIMEKNIGMNPVIMVLAVSVWGYVFGLMGILIAIPLTSLMMIYVKRIVFQEKDA